MQVTKWAFWYGHRGLVAVFSLALLVRAWCLVELQASPFLSVLMADAARYDAWAQEIAGGEWWGREVFYQAPFYPYFLAVCYLLLDRDLMWVRGIQIVLGAVGCVLIARVGRDLFSPKVGLLAGILMALYPPAIFFDLLMQKAALANFLLLLLLALLATQANGERQAPKEWLWWVVAGVVLGCLALTRENTRVLYPVIALWLLLSNRELAAKVRWRRLAAFTTGLVVVLLPVALRNQNIGGELVLTTSQLGPNFYIGNNPEADGTYRALRPGRGNPEFERRDAIDLAEQAEGRKLTAREVSDYWLQRSLTYIRDQPGHWLRLMIRKGLLVLNAEEQADAESLDAYQRHSRGLRILDRGLDFGILLPLALVGIWASRNRWRELWLLYAIFLSLAASVALFFVFARYRFSVAPVLILFAAVGTFELWVLLKHWSPRRLAVPAALAVGGAIVAHLPLSVQLDVEALTYNNLGIALTKEGRIAEATKWYRSAVDTDPDYPAAHYNLGVALLEQNDVEAAVSHFQEARRLEPKFALADYSLGIARVRQGRIEEAIAHYRQALELQPDNPEVHSNLGVALEMRGEMAPAAKHYRLAVELRPDYAEGHYNLGNAQLQLRNYAAAAAAYSRALSLRPDYAEAFYNLGIVYYQQGDREPAIREIRAALQARPDFVAARTTLAQLYIEKGSIPEAITELRAALDLQPDRQDLRHELDRLFQSGG